MINPPLVSIIIPFKGRLGFVRKALNSIYSQSDIEPKHLEVILVEERNYGEVLRHIIKHEFPQIKIFVNQEKEGPGGSRTTGLKYARGEYIVFLDSDDQMRSNFLKEMIQSLETDGRSGAVVCFSKSVFSPSFNILERLKLYPLMFIRDLSLWGFFLLNQNLLIPSAFYLCQISHMMFRSSVAKNLQFKYDYRYGGEDWDFIIDVLNIKPIKILPKRLLNFLYSKGSSTDSPINRRLKWKSYSLLANRLSGNFKKGIYYKLFLRYISVFGDEIATSI